MLENRSTFRKQISAIATTALILASVLTFGATATSFMVAPKASAAPACEDIRIAGVSASGHEAVNPPANAIDNSIRTRWSNFGFGSWITADLGQQQAVCGVDIAWYKGDTRVNDFTVSVSSDGTSFTEVYRGENSGTTASPEEYRFEEAATARYVRITVTDISNGNSEWVSITEIDVNGYAPSPSPTVDTTDPTVRIMSPADDSTVTASAGGTITIQGTATDDTAVKIVEVRIDGGTYAAATPKAPGDWSSWSVVMPITSGYHRIVPRATDSAGNQAWNSIYVTIAESGADSDEDATDPQIAITSPADGSTVALTGSTITIQGTASDSGSGIRTVELRIDSGSYSPATPKAPGDWSSWSISLPITEGERRLVSRATDNAGNLAWNSIYVTVDIQSSSGGGSGGNTPSSTLDKFGIKKIYPTAQGGNEWYVNMEDPDSDPMFRNLETMTRQSDGSWQVDGGSNGQVRLEAWSPVNEKWLNVEITMYAKMVDGSNELLQLYSRGGHHTSRDECLGSAVKARLYGDGEARWVKEINHPAYTSNRGSVDVTDEPLMDRWVGFKAVIYNFVENGKTYVRMESYIDDDVTDSRGNLVIGNNWKLASVVEDRGGWGTNDSDFNSTCAPLNKDSTHQYRQRDEILNMPGGTSTQNIAAFRSDDLTWNWKYLSVREIQPPTA